MPRALKPLQCCLVEITALPAAVGDNVGGLIRVSVSSRALRVACGSRLAGLASRLRLQLLAAELRSGVCLSLRPSREAFAYRTGEPRGPKDWTLGELGKAGERVRTGRRRPLVRSTRPPRRADESRSQSNASGGADSALGNDLAKRRRRAESRTRPHAGGQSRRADRHERDRTIVQHRLEVHMSRLGVGCRSQRQPHVGHSWPRSTGAA
jgi:hypothetical protein